MSNRTLALAGIPGLSVGLAISLLLTSAVSAADDVSPAPSGIAPAAVESIERLISGVPALRELDALAEVPYRAIDSDTFRLELEALFEEEYPPDLVAAEEAAFRRLGLLSPQDDLRELVLGLLSDQALAYYDPRSATITFVGQIQEVGAVESLVVVHEYVHALQDQHWDLEGTRERDPSRSDLILAQSALTEGDATALMYEWAARNLKLGDLIKASEEALSRSDEKLLARMPLLLRRQMVEFPYFDGWAFTTALRARDTGWRAVDAAWEARPVSTEQILHPERYPDDVPFEIVLPDLAGLLGEGWVATYQQTLGEMQMGVWVADGKVAPTVLGLPGKLPRAEAVEGWGGDRLVSLEGPEGAWAVVWQTAWDADREADEFMAAAKRTLKDLPGASLIVAHDIVGDTPSPVLVLVADGGGTLDQLQAGLALP